MAVRLGYEWVLWPFTSTDCASLGDMMPALFASEMSFENSSSRGMSLIGFNILFPCVVLFSCWLEGS